VVADPEQYRDLIEKIGIDVATLITDSKGTLGTAPAQLGDADLDRKLPRMVLAGPNRTPDLAADLELKSTIGSGATATVWAAAQTSLQRTVAVKQLLPERDTPGDRAMLLQEARITGSLEHPNIVPVHALGLTDDGSPLLIMKYIEGTPWQTSLEPLYADETPPPPEAVERQLRILIAVTAAIHFAHERGVLHRDIKPTNVMLGPGDEVYVVDWGLAVALHPEVDLPLAADVAEVSGTPGYMAPEMAASRGKSFTVRTDVYLLGAVLHELITGQRRHQGDSILDRLASAYESAPAEFPSRVPAELAEICNRACHKDPDRRFEDAAAFKLALEDFLRHRGSRELAEDANLRLQRLEAAVERKSDGVKITVDPATWNQWSTEARFGYRHALRDWPQNEAAKEGLQRLLRLLIRRELDRNNPKGAAELLAALPDPDPDLDREIAEVDERVDTQATDAAAMAKLRREQDLSISVSRRRKASVYNGLALLVGAGVLFTLRVTGIREPGYPDIMAVTAFVAFVMFRTERYISEQTGSTWINRRIFGTLIGVVLSITALFGFAWLAGMNIVHAEGLSMLLAGCMALMAAYTIDRNLVWAGLGFLATALGVLLWPEMRGLVIALGGLASFSLGAWGWRKVEPTDPAKYDV
jgi:serine/threonine-protein kinase